MATYNLSTGTWDLSDLMVKLKAEKKAANEFQKRRHEDWTDNYDLYRNRVRVNRLTQRQAVNIPLMKETVETTMASIDDVPNVDWAENSGDEEKELVYQEIWNDVFKTQKFSLVDSIDKKNVLLYGIGTKRLNIFRDGVTGDALDPYDVVYDPLMRVGHVETARFIVHQNIFRSVREILADDRYSQEGKDALKIWADSPPGILADQESKKHWEEKQKRMKDMGVDNQSFPVYAAGDRIVNLSEHFHTIWNTEKKKWERRVVVYAGDTIELLDKSLLELIGVEFWPFVQWNGSPESQDVYADSVADIIRPLNKVINVWYSQLIENRTLKNFQMHWFSPVQGFTPTTYQPGPGMMLPAPPGEDINKVIKPVEISGLDDTLEAINALTLIAERASGATAIQKGTPESGTQTLGEVQILLGKAQERATSMAKFYRDSWYEFAWKWDKMMQANAPKVMKLYKSSRSGKLYPKRVYSSDWVSEAGYEPMVRSTSEQEQESVKTLQKFQFILQQNPNNMALKKIALSRQLESLDLTPEELALVEADQEQSQQQVPEQPVEQQPVSGPDMSNIENLVGQLTG